MMGYGYSMMGGWSGMMIIPIILAVAVMYLIFSQEENNKLKVCKVRDNSINILNERFAHREISEEEYHRIKNSLRS